MKILSIHQPAYLPWLGYFHKLLLSDTFVFLDTVQFEKNSFINRNKVLTANGPVWLTVPVKSTGYITSKLIDLIIAEKKDWKKKHIKTLEFGYSKTAYFKEYFPLISEQILSSSDDFTQLTFNMLKLFLDILKVEVNIVRSSQIPVSTTKSQLVLDLCKYCKADIYISGMFGKDYLDTDSFRREGIGVNFQAYRHPVYAQRFPGFVPNLAIVDVLFNRGAEETRDIIFLDNCKKEDILKKSNL
jgi:hypothetical protein